MRLHHMTTFVVRSLALTALIGTTAVAADDLKKEDPLNLSGFYSIVSGEKDGKALPKDHFQGSVVHFTKDKITGTDKDKKEFFAANYTIEHQKDKTVVRMKATSPKEGDANGLIRKDTDTITIIYALPGGKDPTDFTTRENQHLFVLKRMELVKK